MGNSKIFTQVWSSSFNKEYVFHSESQFPSTLSRERCAYVCIITIFAVPPIRETCVHMCIYAKSRKIRVKNITSNHSFLTEIIFFKLKQFLKTCPPIVKIYFEKILVFGKKFFEISHKYTYMGVFS